MKFKLTKSSDWNFEKEIEFNTLEELISWMKEINEDIIIGLNYLGDGKDFIEIYDYYRE